MATARRAEKQPETATRRTTTAAESSSSKAGPSNTASTRPHSHSHPHHHHHHGSGAAPSKRQRLSESSASKQQAAAAANQARDLYALLGDNAPSLTLAPTLQERQKAAAEAAAAAAAAAASGASARKENKSKAAEVETGGQRWAWKQFKNPAREDGLVLRHWVKETRAKGEERGSESIEEADYAFAKFNTDPGVYQYTTDEYAQHLKDEDWTREETDYLIEMCTRYSLRFTVIADRWDYRPPLPQFSHHASGAPLSATTTSLLSTPGKARTIEDLKARYYAVCRRLIRSRISTDDVETRQALLQTYAFDRAREVERKRGVARLFARTPAQLAEEEALYVEARRVEQNEAKFAGEREELLRLLGGWESLQSATPATIAAAGAGLGLVLPGSAAEAEELKRKRRKAEAESAAAAAAAAATGGTTPGGSTTSTTSLLPFGIVPSSSTSSSSAKHKAAESKQAAFDETHYITRFDPNAVPSSKPPYPHLIGIPSTQPPVAPSVHNASSSHGAYVRSTRLLVAKAHLAQRTAHLLATELRPPLHGRLVFPTAKNCERWEGLLGAVTAGLELKKQLERVEQELRIAKARLDPVGTAAAAASASAAAAGGGTGSASATGQAGAAPSTQPGTGAATAPTDSSTSAAAGGAGTTASAGLSAPAPTAEGDLSTTSTMSADVSMADG